MASTGPGQRCRETPRSQTRSLPQREKADLRGEAQPRCGVCHGSPGALTWSAPTLPQLTTGRGPGRTHLRQVPRRFWRS